MSNSASESAKADDASWVHAVQALLQIEFPQVEWRSQNFKKFNRFSPGQLWARLGIDNATQNRQLLEPRDEQRKRAQLSDWVGQQTNFIKGCRSPCENKHDGFPPSEHPHSTASHSSIRREVGALWGRAKSRYECVIAVYKRQLRRTCLNLIWTWEKRRNACHCIIELRIEYAQRRVRWSDRKR